MDFSVPFISVPVRKAMDMTKGTIAKLNVGAILVSGVIIFGTVVVIPLLINLLNDKVAKVPVQTFFGKGRKLHNTYTIRVNNVTYYFPACP